MKKKISKEMLSVLKEYENKLLLYNNQLLAISEFDYEIEEKKPHFWSLKKKSIIYLTHIELLGYNKKGDFLGYSKDEDCFHFLMFMHIPTLRRKWEDFKKQLAAFNLEVDYIINTEEDGKEE